MALSWKQKFYLLIAATFVGLAVVLLTSLSGLSKVSDAYEARGEARNYEAASLTLLTDWLTVERVSEELNTDMVDDYLNRLASLKQQSEELARNAGSLPDPAIGGMADSIRKAMAQYTGLRRQWLETSQQLGLTHTDGLKAKLAGYVNDDLRQISISLFDNDINTISSSYRDYLETYDPAYAKTIRDTLEHMTGVVQEMDWQDNVIGQAVLGFEKAFNEAQAVIGKLSGMETELQALGKTIQSRITSQDEALRNGLIIRTGTTAEQARSTATWFVVTIAAAVLAGLVLTLTAASRTLVRRLDEVVGLLSRVASGDLSQRLKTGRNARDEFNRLGSAANQMLDDMSAVIGQVITGNQTLAELQAELNSLIAQMGRNGEQVEDETEQTATAVQEISHTAVEIAQYTQSVNDSAQNANAAAQEGAQVIKRSADSMSALAERIQQTHTQIGQLGKTGEKVNSIVDVINGLAEQTNLLALNAAIEAARAGEAGRGFSVVADEVRSLAEKTVSATNGIAEIVSSLNKETSAITRLMEEGLASADQGEKSAEEAAGAIDRIGGAINQLAGDMNQVVSSIEGISTTTEEIAQKVEQIHGHTRETGDIRQQLNAHVERLSSQTRELTASSQRFTLQG
ncbi:methyl-accepting chemotaxis protein [Marinobacter koreensis]|uniref:Methyl-accepting chemotaxis protein n=1 Tax=Marinobacter koreensis TaxID=335974 RepID=A0ABW0RIQ5_9GAMM|nr:methyl-accepting chemotaxis protein [Marinobacter koreensis]MCK7546764.1 methyl-accepting chemotaxis protein [Marinobacter koreensis]